MWVLTLSNHGMFMIRHTDLTLGQWIFLILSLSTLNGCDTEYSSMDPNPQHRYKDQGEFVEELIDYSRLYRDQSLNPEEQDQNPTLMDSGADDITDNESDQQLGDLEMVHVRLKGILTYEDRVYQPNGYKGEHETKRSPFTLVEILDRSTSIDNDIVTSTWTNQDGEYEVDLYIDPTHSYQFRVGGIFQIGPHQVEVRNRQRPSALYMFTHSLDLSEALSGSLELLSQETDSVLEVEYNLTQEAESLGSAVLNIGTVSVLGLRLLRQFDLPAAPPLVFQWEQGRAFSCGSCYSNNRVALGGQIEDPDHYDDHIIAHEMGHYFVEHWSLDDSPGGPHRRRAVDPLLAYGEGLAYFWAAWVLQDPIIVDDMSPSPWIMNLVEQTLNGDPITLLAPDATWAMPHHEEVISTLMWSLYQTLLSDEDYITLLTELIPLKEVDVGVSGMDLADFLNQVLCGLDSLSIFVGSNEDPALEERVRQSVYAESEERGYPWSSNDVQCSLKGDPAFIRLRPVTSQKDTVSSTSIPFEFQWIHQSKRPMRYVYQIWQGLPPHLHLISEGLCQTPRCSFELTLSKTNPKAVIGYLYALDSMGQTPIARTSWVAPELLQAWNDSKRPSQLQVQRHPKWGWIHEF